MSRELRPIRVEGPFAYVSLTRGYEAVIDALDVPKIEGRNWSALVSPKRKAVYAARVDTHNYKQSMVLMHRVIAGVSDDMHVDHIDGDGLNNRRANLRECTQAENNLNQGRRSDNKSGFKGVFFDNRSGKWRAEIRRGGTTTYLGFFESPAEGHEAYLAAAEELHGEFRRQE